MRVRLWCPWLGPEGWVPAGEEVEVAPDVGAAIAQAGQGEIIIDHELAMLAAPETAVAIPRTRRPKRRKRR